MGFFTVGETCSRHFTDKADETTLEEFFKLYEQGKAGEASQNGPSQRRYVAISPQTLKSLADGGFSSRYDAISHRKDGQIIIQIKWTEQ